jgi:hypothetical protein
MKADLQFWMTAGIFIMTAAGVLQRTAQWWEARRSRKLHEQEKTEDE